MWEKPWIPTRDLKFTNMTEIAVIATEIKERSFRVRRIMTKITWKAILPVTRTDTTIQRRHISNALNNTHTL